MSGIYPQNYLILCEGVSECNYLNELTKFIKNNFPLSSQGNFVQFIPKPPDRDKKTGKLEGCGDGKYTTVIKCYKSEKKKNKNQNIAIWVDSDLYVRNDSDCLTSYRGKPANIPDFKFSLHNFEDFLAFHADDDQYKEWKLKMEEEGHFVHPLHSRRYLPIFTSIFNKYRKGKLDPFRINEHSLNNLFRHLRHDQRNFTLGDLRGGEPFALFLMRILSEAYPQKFGDIDQ